MNIQEMELVVRVTEAGSMTLAAQQLRLTPAAVSAAIQRIEKALQIRLFNRTTRSIQPTDEGRVVIEGCRDVVELWRRTVEAAHGNCTELEGTVHLSAPADTTYEILEPVLLDLCAAYPKLRVVLATSDAVLDIHRDAIDIAIRYGRLQDSTLFARKLAESPGILVAAPSYLAERGTPSQPDELHNHRCLTLQLSNVPMTSWELSRDGQTQTLRLQSPLCGDGYLTRRWAVAGMGIALKSVFDVIDDLEAGRLVRVLPAYVGGEFAVHAVFPSRRFQTARVRAVHAAITAHFAPRAARCTQWLVDFQTKPDGDSRIRE